MKFMSGAALTPAPLGSRTPHPGDDDEELFATALVASNPPKRRAAFGAQVSLVVHVLCVSALILVPIFWPSENPVQPDLIAQLIYDPPPPPPPPLNKGSELARKTTVAKPVTPDPEVKKEPKFEAPIEKPPEEKPLT